MTPDREETRRDENSPTLQGVVAEVESFVREDGWDQSGRLFALVSTTELVEAQPDLAAELLPGHAGPDTPYTPVEQEIDAKSYALEDLLEVIAWPSAVVGAVAVIERVVLPPEAEAEVPDDPEEADQFASEHPDRQDVRIAAGVLRTGESHCVIRVRARDSDDHLLQGEDLVPGLVEALRETLEAEAGDEVEPPVDGDAAELPHAGGDRLDEHGPLGPLDRHDDQGGGRTDE